MGTINFQPLKVRRLSEIVETAIKDRILTGAIKPGAKLPTEKQLGQQFGVSTVTVREALRGLQSMGVIEKKRGKGGGIFITEARSDTLKAALHDFLSSKKFTARDVVQLRIILEPAAAAIAATDMTPAELKNLEKSIKYFQRIKSKATRALLERDKLETHQRDMEFHRVIGKATHNPALSLTIDYALDCMSEFGWDSLATDIKNFMILTEQHFNIFTYIKERDAKRAKEAMLLHLQWADSYYASTKSD